MQGLSPNLPMPKPQPVINQDVPAYVVSEKQGFYDDTDKLWPKGSMIYWEGIPSPGFEPLNELAEEKLREYFTLLDKKASEVASAKGMGHASLVNAFDAKRRLADMDRKAGRSVDIDEMTPIMGIKREASKARDVFATQNQVTPMMGYKRKGKPQAES